MQKQKIGPPEFGILARTLRSVDFFAPLTVGQIEQILPYVMLQSYEPGEVIFKQGERGDAFYIVYKGAVEIKVKKGFFSFGKTVARLSENQFFGEIALLSAEPRTATVTCAEPTQLFVLVATDFRFVIQSNPSMAREMEKIAAHRKFDSRHQSQ
jgi:CRP-like cAMP-binding protein